MKSYFWTFLTGFALGIWLIVGAQTLSHSQPTPATSMIDQLAAQQTRDFITNATTTPLFTDRHINARLDALDGGQTKTWNCKPASEVKRCRDNEWCPVCTLQSAATQTMNHFAVSYPNVVYYPALNAYMISGVSGTVFNSNLTAHYTILYVDSTDKVVEVTNQQP